MSENNSQTQAYLSWQGNRVRTAYDSKFLSELWLAEKNGIVTRLSESTRNMFMEAQIGINQNVEVFFPATTWGATPYNGTPSWDFLENYDYILGSYVDIDSSGNTSIPTRSSDGTYSAVPTGYTRYPAPSLITDKAGGQHVVYPVWGWWLNGSFVFEDGTALDSSLTQYITHHDDIYEIDGSYLTPTQTGNVRVYPLGDIGFAPFVLTFLHNMSLKGGDLDSHAMFDIPLSGSASAAQTITGLQTTQEVKVGQMGQFETTDNGVTKPWPCIVTAVTEPAQEGDPYTFSLLSVSEASGPVANLKLYQAV